MNTSDPTFKYYALRFLHQWAQRECALSKQIAGNPTVQELRSALQHFQVARTFTKLSEAQKAQCVIDALCHVSNKPDLSPVEKVTALTKLFYKEFEKCNLSAASKLLWLKHKTDYIIYDRRAVCALKDLGGDFERTDYAKYCDCWRSHYEKHERKIKAAASSLDGVRLFLPTRYRTGSELDELVKKQWFLERVFDLYLWEMGAPA